MGADLCSADEAVGAYVLRVTEGMVISSRVEIDGPLAIYASVVDRSRQDGRVVLPLPME